MDPPPKKPNSRPSPSPSPPRAVVHGVDVTPLTQCRHWHSPLDIIAIRHRCCGKLYACRACHDELETHAPAVWPADRRDERAVLCGACGLLLSIDEYMRSGSACWVERPPAKGERDDDDDHEDDAVVVVVVVVVVKGCGSSFNPGCKNHWALYFEMLPGEVGEGGGSGKCAAP